MYHVPVPTISSNLLSYNLRVDFAGNAYKQYVNVLHFV